MAAHASAGGRCGPDERDRWLGSGHAQLIRGPASLACER